MEGDCFTEGYLLEFAESELHERGTPKLCATGGALVLSGKLGLRYASPAPLVKYPINATAGGIGYFVDVPPDGGWDGWLFTAGGGWGGGYGTNGKPGGTRWRIDLRLETFYAASAYAGKPPTAYIRIHRKNAALTVYPYTSDEELRHIATGDPNCVKPPSFPTAWPHTWIVDCSSVGVWTATVYVYAPKDFCQPQFWFSIAGLTDTGYAIVPDTSLDAAAAWPSVANDTPLLRFDADAVRLDEGWIATLSISASTGKAPLTVFLSDTTSLDGSIVDRTFTFGDGASQTHAPSGVSHTYTTPGVYAARLTATDATGRTTTSAPRRIVALVNGDFNWSVTTIGLNWRFNFSTVAFSGAWAGATHAWNFGPYGTSTLANPTLTVPIGTSVTAAHTATYNGTSDTVTHVVS